MKIRYIKYWAFAAVLGMGTVSCEDFLNRPTEDNYNESNFYQNDEHTVLSFKTIPIILVILRKTIIFAHSDA